jgi:hypothetical protein
MKIICTIFSIGALLCLAAGCGNVLKKTYTRIGDGYVLGYVYGEAGKQLFYITDEHKGEDVVPWGIEKLAISRGMIYGKCRKVIFPPERPDWFKGIGPEPFDGYFVLDKKSRTAHLNLSEHQFRAMLEAAGFAWPPTLHDPTRWLR